MSDLGKKGRKEKYLQDLETNSKRRRRRREGRMDGQGSYTICREAQLKILLHGIKYPYAEVNGLLLGVPEGDDKVIVQDAIPLFHSLVFTPMLETSMLLIEQYCKSDQTPKNTQIVGWYYGASRNNAVGVPEMVSRIASKIRAKNETCGTCLVLINDKELENASASCIKVLTKQKDSSTWIQAPTCSVESGEKFGKELTKLISQGRQEKVVDMDTWLEDTSLDWRNPELLQ